jgi:hypothetical protein
MAREGSDRGNVGGFGIRHRSRHRGGEEEEEEEDDGDERRRRQK